MCAHIHSSEDGLLECGVSTPLFPFFLMLAFENIDRLSGGGQKSGVETPHSKKGLREWVRRFENDLSQAEGKQALAAKKFVSRVRFTFVSRSFQVRFTNEQRPSWEHLCRMSPNSAVDGYNGRQTQGD